MHFYLNLQVLIIEFRLLGICWIRKHGKEEVRYCIDIEINFNTKKLSQFILAR